MLTKLFEGGVGIAKVRTCELGYEMIFESVPLLRDLFVKPNFKILSTVTLRNHAIVTGPIIIFVTT